jgi:predicted nuclease of restriction endonuclease-like RecB superfamily
MLTGDLVRPRLHRRGDRLYVTLLKADKYAQQTSSDLIALFNQHLSQPLRAWHAALEAYEGERTDYIIIRGLAKVLEDAAVFTPLETPISPPELREIVFARGPVFEKVDLFHPLSQRDTLETIASELPLSVSEIETLLFADLPDEYLLTDVGTAWTPEDLIARYNLELARGVLYWSSEMRIDIRDSYKDFWRYLKLFKLMFWATLNPDSGYHVTLDGPISPFVKSTTRYGRQFAAFLPALFLCEHWQMDADVRFSKSDKVLNYHLDPKIPLTSHFKRSGQFDSKMEADFAAEFEAKFGSERGQWVLTREDEILLLGDTVMIPDFALTNQTDGRRALIEIVGFWHPDYLRRKIEKIRAANRKNLILLVYEGVNLTPDRLRETPGEVLYFPRKPVLKDVMAAVERVAE